MQLMFYMYFTGELPTSNESPETHPDKFHLSQNYPNPFNGSTTINYYTPTEAKVRVRVYDVLGQEVTLLSNKVVPPGEHSVNWDAAGLPSGVYFINLEAGKTVRTRTAFLIK